MTDDPRKNSKGTYLPEDCLGQFKNPEIQKKALATRMRNAEEKRRRKEAAQTGFGLSELSDPAAQAKLIDRLYQWALSEDFDVAKYAMKTLSDMGVTKQPAEKPEMDEPTSKEQMSIEDSIAILKRAQKEASDE